MFSAIERMRVMCMIALVYIRVNIYCTTENTNAAPVTRSSRNAVCLSKFVRTVNPSERTWLKNLNKSTRTG